MSEIIIRCKDCGGTGKIYLAYHVDEEPRFLWCECATNSGNISEIKNPEFIIVRELWEPERNPVC